MNDKGRNPTAGRVTWIDAPGSHPHYPGARWLERLLAAGTSDRPASRPIRYGGTVLLLLVVTELMSLVSAQIGLLNIGCIYLVAVIAVTVLAGRGPGIMASFLAFALFDFFLIPPYLTFAIAGLEDILALFVFLGVSMLLSSLLAQAREQTKQAQQQAEDISRLYALNQAIVGPQDLDEMLNAIASKVAEVFGAKTCRLLVPEGSGQERLVVAAASTEDGRAPTREEMSTAEWCFRTSADVGYTKRPAEGGSPAKSSHSNLPAREQIEVEDEAFVPMRAGRRTLGVIVVADKKGGEGFAPAERAVLATFADQAGAAVERLMLLREARRAEVLARTDELKSALISAVSHDLRTPLASITAAVTSLLEPDMEWDEATRHEFLQGIYDEARRLNHFVGDLLDMSRIEGGALHPSKDWYAIGEVIEGVVQRLEPNLAGRKVEVHVQEDLPLIPLDFTQIGQVLTNLVENAIKYTPAGTPITIEAKRTGDGIEVSVSDRGPGVAPEHLSHIFDRFYTANARRGEGGGRGGTGLGLAISKGLVEAHGGRIWAVNRPGGGLQVTFALPVGEGARGVNGAGRAQHDISHEVAK